MRSFIFLLILLNFALAIVDQSLQVKWTRFKDKYGKTYYNAYSEEKGLVRAETLKVKVKLLFRKTHVLLLFSNN